MKVTMTRPLSTATPRQRDEADAGRDRKRHAAQPQRQDAAGQRQRHAAEDQQRVARPSRRRMNSKTKISSSATGTTIVSRLRAATKILELSAPCRASSPAGA